MRNTTRKRKMLASLIAAATIGLPFSQSIELFPAPSTAQASNLTSLIGLTGLGMKINSVTKYNYSMPPDLSAAILCRATNEASQNPTAGQTGTYSCHVIKLKQDSKYIFPTGYTTGKLTYSGGRDIVTLQIGYTKVTGYKDGKPLTENGSIPITIHVDSGRAVTAITDGGGVSPWVDGGVVTGPGNGPTLVPTPGGVKKPAGWDPGNEGTQRKGTEGTYTDGLGLCSDGTYFCPEETGTIYPSTTTTDSGDLGWPTDISLPSFDDNTNTGGINAGGNGGNTGNGGTLGQGDGLKTTTTDNGGSTTSGTKPNYGDVIDDMLGDDRNSSYDSPNIDWGSSTGNGDAGEDNLDDYFNGIDDAGSLPDGVTLDGDIEYAENNPIVDDGGYVEDGAGATDEGGIEPGSESNGENSNGGAASPFGSFDSIPDSYQTAVDALDGKGDSSEKGDKSANGIFGDMGDGESLKDKISSMLGKDKTASGNKKSGATEQDLFDYAKKFLLANGYTAADIASGKNYDDGSSYTEPVAAWDMNRITTLLRGRKISLTSPSEVQPKSETSALSHVSKAALTSPNAKNADGSTDEKGVAKQEKKGTAQVGSKGN